MLVTRLRRGGPFRSRLAFGRATKASLGELGFEGGDFLAELADDFPERFEFGDASLEVAVLGLELPNHRVQRGDIGRKRSVGVHAEGCVTIGCCARAIATISGENSG
jgi:hypothetical protein